MAAAVTAVYNVDFSSGTPTLTEREQPSYSAQGRLLITDQSASHLRVAITKLQAVTSDAEGTPRLLPVTSAPDIGTLVAAANLYPSLIESDEVAEIRESTFGANDGEIKAQALHAIASPSRFAPSRIPVIQLIAVADSPKKAIALVTHTSTAFNRWLAQRQQQSGVKPFRTGRGRRASDAEGRRRVRRRLIDAAGARLRRRADGVRRARLPLRSDVPAAARGAGSGGRDGTRAGAHERMTCAPR